MTLVDRKGGLPVPPPSDSRYLRVVDAFSEQVDWRLGEAEFAAGYFLAYNDFRDSDYPLFTPATVSGKLLHFKLQEVMLARQLKASIHQRILRTWGGRKSAEEVLQEVDAAGLKLIRQEGDFIRSHATTRSEESAISEDLEAIAELLPLIPGINNERILSPLERLAFEGLYDRFKVIESTKDFDL